MLIAKNAKFYLDDGNEIPCERVSVELMNTLGINRETAAGMALVPVTWESKVDPAGMEVIRKAFRPTFTFTIDHKIPGVKKGETVTLTVGDEERTGELYHVRKPYKGSETRTYYFRNAKA